MKFAFFQLILMNCLVVVALLGGINGGFRDKDTAVDLLKPTLQC